MAKGFRNQLQKQKDQRQQAASMPEAAPASGLQEREVMLPTEQLNHRVLQDVSRAELEPNGQIIRVPINEVYAVKQVRPEEDFEAATIEGMASSFDEVGILSPPRCYPRDKRGYRILFGETRWRSEKQRGEKYIDIYVGPPPKDDRERIISQLSENIHQSGLKPLATANNMLELKTTWNMSQAEIAKVLGKPQTYVSKHMRLLDAPEVVKSLLKDKVTKDLDMVYTLSQISDINPDRAEKMVELLRDGKLTRGSAIKELNLLKGKPAVPPKSTEQNDQDSGETVGVPAGTSEPAKAAIDNPGTNDNQPETAESNAPEKDDLPGTAGEPVVSSRPATGNADGDEQQPESVKRDDPTGEEQIVPRQAAALAAAPTVTPAVTTRRIVVMVDGEEGYLVTDKTPDEFGLVWIKFKIGEVCIEAKDVTVLGIKEV
ncbi:MAG: ParB/RepB/Spo0J family partition protein [Serratia sp. (in: enterobacteria)]|uniref:ParB/RepB/Spo0J family partition protein n=1 Tax=Serratia sp. (in: enterobacteria) TaxID=616 RepID=UPI003F2AACEA